MSYRRQNRRKKDEPIPKPKKLGTITADHRFGKKKVTQGVAGEKDGFTIYDLGTEFGYMYGLPHKNADETTVAAVHFLSWQASMLG